MLIKGDPLRQRGLSELKLSQLAAEMRISAAAAPEHKGQGVPDMRCVRVLARAGIVLLFSRDSDMHGCGWFKNPDFERCWHLSLSFRDPMTGEAAPFDSYVAERIARAFFADHLRFAWTEGAKTNDGKRLGVVHYRVFCTEAWEAFHPRGEVYCRELTEKGWQSWSDRHGDEPEPSSVHAG